MAYLGTLKEAGRGGAGSSSPFGSTADSVEAMVAPHAVFSEDLAVDKRPSREELITTANYYFSGLQNNDGKGYYPFTDDCIRFENGMDELLSIDTGMYMPPAHHLA